MILSDIILKQGTNETIIHYNNESLQYDAIMAAALNFKAELEEIKSILESVTGRNNISIWCTELNTFYSTLGYRQNQQFEFRSAISLADMAIQETYGGAAIIQTHSLLNDFYFSFLHEAKTLADSSVFDTYSLVIDGWGQYLLNSTIDSPTFDLLEDYGWISAINNTSYLTLMPTLDGDHLQVVMINKHPTEWMDVSLDIEGFFSTPTATLTTVNSSSINAMDYNPPDNYYNYSNGINGSAIKLNSTHLIRYPSNEKVLEREGTIEFWMQPEWNGNDGLKHPIISIGNTFFLGKYDDNFLYAVMLDEVYNSSTMKVIGKNVSDGVAGEWHHIAVTWDINGNFTLYIDGNLVSTLSFKNFRTFFEHHQPIVFGSYRNDLVNGSDALFDEFRISKVARTSAEIWADFIAGNNTGTPLTADGNTTILLHFDGTLEDVVEDQRTYINTREIFYHSSGGVIRLPPCSISLLILQRYQAPPPPDTTKPTITLISPENKTYSTTVIDLQYSIDEAVTWIKYTLNGAENISLTGNTTLAGLGNGTYYLVLYAMDLSGNVNQAEVYFTILIPGDNNITTEDNGTQDENNFLEIFMLIAIAGSIIAIIVIFAKKLRS